MVAQVQDGAAADFTEAEVLFESAYEAWSSEARMPDTRRPVLM